MVPRQYWWIYKIVKLKSNLYWRKLSGRTHRISNMVTSKAPKKRKRKRRRIETHPRIGLQITTSALTKNMAILVVYYKIEKPLIWNKNWTIYRMGAIVQKNRMNRLTKTMRPWVMMMKILPIKIWVSLSNQGRYQIQ